MSTIASRTDNARLCVARLQGHREGYRVLNGGVSGMSPVEQEFRYRMHELAGEAQQLGELLREGNGFFAGLADLWKNIYGLHEYADKSDRMDDMIMLLMMARKEWRGMEIKAEQLDAVQECLNRMATEPHTQKLMLELGKKLKRAGVDLNSGF